MSERTAFVEAPLIDRDQARLVCVFGAGRLYNRAAHCALSMSADAKIRRIYSSTDPVAGTRRCCTCDVVKPLAEFYRDKHNTFGRMHECAPCHRTTQAKRNTDRRVA